MTTPTAALWVEFGKRAARLNRKVSVDGHLYTKRQCFLQALHLDPQLAAAWNAVAVTMTTTTTVTVNNIEYTKLQCFLQALHFGEIGAHREEMEACLIQALRCAWPNGENRWLRDTATVAFAAANDFRALAVELLNNPNADIDEPDHMYGLTPVSWAARNGAATLVEVFVVRGANLDANDPYGRTALHHAALGSRAECVATLVAAGANVLATDNEGKKPADVAPDPAVGSFLRRDVAPWLLFLFSSARCFRRRNDFARAASDLAWARRALEYRTMGWPGAALNAVCGAGALVGDAVDFAGRLIAAPAKQSAAAAPASAGSGGDGAASGVGHQGSGAMVAGLPSGDVVGVVLTFLPRIEQLNWRLVCRHWRCTAAQLCSELRCGAGTSPERLARLVLVFPNLLSVNLGPLDLGRNYGFAARLMLVLLRLPRLKTLDVSTRPVDQAACAVIALMPALKSLTLGGVHVTDAALARVCEVTRLTTLDLAGCTELTSHGAAHLARLTALRTLRLPHQANDAWLAAVRRLEALTSLWLAYCHVSDAGVERLSPLWRLKELDLSKCRSLGNRSLATVGRFELLERLDLSGLPQLTHELLEELRGSTELRELRLSECPLLRDEALNTVAKFKNLQVLAVSCCYAITDVGVVAIARLPNLETLVLSRCTGLTDNALGALCGSKTLRRLDVSGCGWIKNAGLAFIGEIRTLVTLNLNFCRGFYTDGLLRLHGLASLKTLGIDGCKKVSKEGVDALRKAIPDVKVSHDRFAREG